MTIEINTRHYEFAHGKKPRGYGHWAFFFRASSKIEDTFWVEGKYGDAAKEARKEARRRKVSEVIVGS